jgi:hypothetical protein
LTDVVEEHALSYHGHTFRADGVVVNFQNLKRASVLHILENSGRKLFPKELTTDRGNVIVRYVKNAELHVDC